MRSKYVSTFLSFLVLCISLTAFTGIFSAPANANQAPVVSNVYAHQRSGTKLVDITYDVSDPDGDLLTISVEVSDDGGSTFTVPAYTFTGDVGSNITPGPGKSIVWNAGVDVPEVCGTGYRIKITARDGGDICGDGQNGNGQNGGGSTCASADGAPMVLIPAGEFSMGDSLNEGHQFERPVHTVYIDAFCIDAYEVTNIQYATFLNAYGGIIGPAGNELIDIESSHCLIEKVGNTYAPKAGYGSFPVVMVSWFGAKAYAEFYGKRLPTEAEWEKAARGGFVGRRYPWGANITPNDANYEENTGGDPITKLYPVGSFAPNGYGLYDVIGNLKEWCSDWYYPDNYYEVSPYENPQGFELGYTRVTRGGGYWESAEVVRVAARNYLNPEWGRTDIGFRCVSYPAP